MLVEKHCFFAVADSFLVDDGFYRKFQIFGEQEEFPAAVLFEYLTAEHEACAADGTARAKAHAGTVQILRFAQEPETVACGNPVVAVVFRVAIACYYAVALRECLIHLGDVVFIEDIVRIENEISVKAVPAIVRIYAVEQIFHGVAFADASLIEALIHGGAEASRYLGCLIRAVVGNDENLYKRTVILLIIDALDEISDDDFLIARGDENGILVVGDGSFALLFLCEKPRYYHIEKLIAVAQGENYRYDIIYIA